MIRERCRRPLQTRVQRSSGYRILQASASLSSRRRPAAVGRTQDVLKTAAQGVRFVSSVDGPSVELTARLSAIVTLIEGGSVAELTATAVSDFAAAVKRPAAAVAADRVVQESVVAAMYVDSQRRQNRATNFIVSGLAISDIRSDRDAVVDLCRREFSEAPDIVYCKRLGKPASGRVQPLLVVLKTAAQAVRFVSSAKKLRQSTDPVTNASVYIAANFTKAEAKAAYLVRCERRQAADLVNNNN